MAEQREWVEIEYEVDGEYDRDCQWSTLSEAIAEWFTDFPNTNAGGLK